MSPISDGAGRGTLPTLLFITNPKEEMEMLVNLNQANDPIVFASSFARLQKTQESAQNPLLAALRATRA